LKLTTATLALLSDQLNDDDDDVKRSFQPTQRTQRKERNGTNVRYGMNVRNVTKWRHYWIGQSQQPATTVYAAGTLPSCGRHTP